MAIEFLLLLAIVQGLTEFLPVSSSAHLILLPAFTGHELQSFEIDIAVHFGSLFAVMIYFHRETKRLIVGCWDICRFRPKTPAAQLSLKLIVASIPVLGLGFLLGLSGWIDALRNPILIGSMMILFALVLWFVDQRAPQNREFDDFTFRDAMIMGLWQMFALLPGTSRSGATVTASRALGFNRQDGAKLAMLMSIPVILAGGCYLLLKIITADASSELGRDALIAGFASFIAALFALTLMMRFLASISYTPYVIYRIVVGIIIFAYFGI